MQINLKIFLCLFVLIAQPACAETSQKKTPVADNGETVISASSRTYKVRVVIKTHKVQKESKEKWDNKLSFVPSTCTFSDWCSLVDKIEITVNGKQIIAPHSLISNLAILHHAELKMDGDKMSLLLDSGDASESYFIKIDFDRERVKRMSVFADNSMKADRLLAETTYHLVVD